MGRSLPTRGFLLLATCAALVTLVACGGGASAPAPVPSAGVPSTLPLPTPTTSAGASGAIKHVVIIVQENRSFDNLFNGYPGADTAQSGATSTGQTVALQPVGFTAPKDISHSHPNWYREYANGKLFFDLGTPKGASPTYPYAYIPQSETVPYWTLAQRYTLADRMFQSNTGPSFVAHQYLIAGSSQIGSNQFVDENPNQTNSGVPTLSAWGCDDPAGTTVALLGPSGTDITPGPFPCFDYRTVADELDAKSLPWRYYAPTVGTSGAVWSAYDAIKHIRSGADWTSDVISPETKILTDPGSGVLADVTWVAPSIANSDHAGSGSAAGPQWVASIVNAVGQSPYWSSTAIFITWDDWGGWFDHVSPPQLDSMGLGFRVPLLVVSPYAKRGYVSHVQHEFGSILKFTEEDFGLAPLAASDARADDLSDCFDFSQSPQPFVPLAVTRRPASFTQAPPQMLPPDGD